MIYTIHVGPRTQDWPSQVATATTRGEAQRLARTMLQAAPASHTKAEVRCNVELLDCFGRYSTGTVRSVYAARQRGGLREDQS